MSVSGEMLFGISWKLFVELCLFFVHSCFSFFSQTFCFFLASEVQGSLSQRLATSPISCLFLKVNVFPYIEISGRSSMETIIRLYADCTSLLVQNDSDLLIYSGENIRFINLMVILRKPFSARDKNRY